jgi:hypothetical protein
LIRPAPFHDLHGKMQLSDVRSITYPCASESSGLSHEVPWLPLLVTNTSSLLLSTDRANSSEPRLVRPGTTEQRDNVNELLQPETGRRIQLTGGLKHGITWHVCGLLVDKVCVGVVFVDPIVKDQK